MCAQYIMHESNAGPDMRQLDPRQLQTITTLAQYIGGNAVEMYANPCSGWKLDHWEIRDSNYEWQPVETDDHLTVYMNWWDEGNITHVPPNKDTHYVKAVFKVGCSPDLYPPKISLLGGSAVIVECAEEYVDPGATAEDECDGDVTGDIVIGGDEVNADVKGNYTITYTVTDEEGNASGVVTRTVSVVDTEPPVNYTD